MSFPIFEYFHNLYEKYVSESDESSSMIQCIYIFVFDDEEKLSQWQSSSKTEPNYVYVGNSKDISKQVLKDLKNIFEDIDNMLRNGMTTICSNEYGQIVPLIISIYIKHKLNEMNLKLSTIINRMKIKNPVIFSNGIKYNELSRRYRQREVLN